MRRPILFSAPMVRALLDGSKTQTRRVCKPAEDAKLPFVVEVPDPQERGHVYNGSHFGNEEGGVQFACPYGGVGERFGFARRSHPSFTGATGEIAAAPENERHPAFCHYAADWLHSRSGG